MGRHLRRALPPDRQDFPLNDDWAYSKGAFAFWRGEGIHYYRQPSMPLLGQWLLAYPVTRIAGESHVALRTLTITLSVFGLLAFYDLMRREARASCPEAGFAAACLALNPIFFLMSGTFMSDVPSLSLSLVSLAFYTRAMKSKRFWTSGVGAAVATLATVTRQNAIVTPIVAGILLWRHPALRWSPSWLIAIGLPLIAGVLVHFWFTARPDTGTTGAETPLLGAVLGPMLRSPSLPGPFGASSARVSAGGGILALVPRRDDGHALRRLRLSGVRRECVPADCCL